MFLKGPRDGSKHGSRFESTHCAILLLFTAGQRGEAFQNGTPFGYHFGSQFGGKTGQNVDAKEAKQRMRKKGPHTEIWQSIRTSGGSPAAPLAHLGLNKKQQLEQQQQQQQQQLQPLWLDVDFIVIFVLFFTTLVRKNMLLIADFKG